ncbi:axin-1 [Nephila pilipes]|uniref:Axin-1 n=1 Tax=Nephila pilipes TaxID=299642 RepID=A0A8X6IM10_NEPPI|nr:axin-1 [Nephila pilipes]
MPDQTHIGIIAPHRPIIDQSQQQRSQWSHPSFDANLQHGRLIITVHSHLHNIHCLIEPFAVSAVINHYGRQSMREDPFISILIQKLNNLKRDQEVREHLEDSIQEFKTFQSKVLNKKPPCYSKNKLPPPTYQVKSILKKSKSRNTPSNPIVFRNATQPIQKTLETTKSKPQKTVVETKKDDFTIVGYCIGGNPVPYSTKVRGKRITLGHFKTLFNRKGNFRYFFKRYCNEFGTNVVFEEITDDEEVLPLWDGKIFGLVEEMEECRL